MGKSFKLGFFGAILVWVPVLLLGIFERQISEFIGRPVWIIAMITFSVGALFLHLYPFFYQGPGSYNFFWGKGKRAREIKLSGRPATATLLEIGENSGGGTVTINDNPYLNLKLQIDDEKTEPYQVSLDTVVPRYSVPMFQPGFSFPVRIDRQNPQIIVYDADEAALQNKGLIFSDSKPKVYSLDRTPEETSYIHKKGTKAEVRILDVKPTGKSADFKPIVNVDYEVRIPGEEPYEITGELPVPTHMVEQLKQAIGKDFPAKVHPEDRNKISVDVKF